MEKTTIKALNGIKNMRLLPILVDFYADWCQPCKVLSPLLEVLEKEYEGRVVFYKVDADKTTQDELEMYRITSIPTVMFISGGEVLHTITGFNGEEKYRTILDALV